MATLLGLPNELLICICECIWPEDGCEQTGQLLPIGRLRQTCRRFSFLADLRYLTFGLHYGNFAFTSYTLEQRKDGPEYLLDHDFEYCGYCEYQMGKRLHRALAVAVGHGAGYRYCISDSVYVDNEYSHAIYRAIAYDLYEDVVLPPDVAEFIKRRPCGASAKQMLIAPCFPLVPYTVDPALLASLEKAPPGDACELAIFGRD